MKHLFSRVARCSLAVLALTGAACAVTAGSALAAYDPADPAQKAQYDQALSLGTQAYVFGIPLLNMQKTFETTTSVNVCDDQANGPVNQLCPVRELLDATFKTVVAPNQDTLYSNAWLDLSKDAMVIRVPDGGARMNVVPLLTPYEENFGSIGNGTSGLLPPGDYVVTGPKQRGRKLPAGLTEIESPYNRAWIIQRTYIDNHDPSDYVPTHAIQDATKIVPLKEWCRHGADYRPKPPKKPDTTINNATIPGTQPGDDPLAFFDALNVSMGQFRPTAEDQPLISQLAAVGIVPGGKPVTKNKKLSDATRAGLSDAVTAGKAKVNATLTGLFQSGFAAHNGYLVAPTGNYGTDYGFRAVVDQIGLGALPKNVALYPIAQTDRLGAPLDGANKRYVIHLNAPGSPLMPQLPVPAEAFWSVTMYDLAGFFVPNALDRYLINDRSDLHYNADGSLDLYVQKDAPADAEQRKNWLPAPAAGFRMIWRLYGTPAGEIDGVISGSGWKAGTVLPCTATGFTPPLPPAGIASPIACAAS